MYLALIMLYYRLEIHYGLGGSKTVCSDIMPALFKSSAKETEKPNQKNVYWFHKVFIFVGFSTNMAWLSFAVVLNFIIALRNSGWSTSAGPDTIAVGGNPDFAVMAIVLVSILASYLALKFGDIPFALVVMWALGGINRMQTVNDPSRFPVELQSQEVAQWSIAMLIYMGVISGISLLRIILQTKNSCCYGKCFRAEQESVQKLITADDEESAPISGENLI